MTASTVNGEGFTLISPSVYLAIQSLYASDYCGPVSAATTAATVGFNASALSTARAYRWDTKLYPSIPFEMTSFLQPQWYGGFEQATWGTSRSCGDILTEAIGTVFSTDSTASTRATITSGYTFTYDPCSPLLSVPWVTTDAGFNSLNELLTKCIVINLVLSDPPYALSTAGALVAPSFTTVLSAQAETTSSTSAAAGQSIQPVVSSTTAPIIVQPTSTQAPVQPVQPSAIISQSNADPTTSTSLVANIPSTSQDPTLAAANDPSSTSQTSAIDPNNSLPSSSSIAPQKTLVATLGSTTITANSASELIIASQTLTPGGQITITGSSTSTTISLASNGQTLNIDRTTTQILQPVSIDPAVIIGTQTLSAGGPAITVSGTILSLQTGGNFVIIGGSTQPISAIASITTPTAYIVGSQTLSAGGPALTISGTIISLPTGGALVVIGGTTQALSILAGITTPSVYAVGTQTLAAGGSAITLSGTVISLQNGGASVVIGGTTQPVSALLQNVLATTPIYVIGTQTLSAGGSAITVSGTILSLQSGGSNIVVGGSTTQAVSVLVGSHILTPEYIIASQTLVAGGAAITVVGVTLSLLSGGSSVIVGSETEGVSFLTGGPSSTSSVGLGGIIATIGGFGAGSTTTTSSSSLSTSTGKQSGKATPAAYTGGVGSLGVNLGLGVGIWLGIICTILYSQ